MHFGTLLRMCLLIRSNRQRSLVMMTITWPVCCACETAKVSR